MRIQSPRFWTRFRVGAGVWLLILTAILYGYDRGGWWRVLLIAAAAGHFYFAYRLIACHEQPVQVQATDSTVGECRQSRGSGRSGIGGRARQSWRAASETLASMLPGGADRV